MSFNRAQRSRLLFLARLAVALIFMLPLLWMASASLHRLGVPLPVTVRLLPESPTLSNFGRVWDILPMTRFTLNSLLVTALAVPLTLVTASWTGLGMARLPRSAQRRWVIASLAVLMVPGIALWSTRFLVYRTLGWYDSVWALIAPAWMGTSPFFVLMYYRAFRRIAAEVYESALLDGAGVLRTWWQVALPLARGTTLGVALLAFIVYWGDFISPLLYLNNESRYTLPVALRMLEQLTRADWGLLMAAALWATAVPLLLFVLAQPLFVKRAE